MRARTADGAAEAAEPPTHSNLVVQVGEPISAHGCQCDLLTARYSPVSLSPQSSPVTWRTWTRHSPSWLRFGTWNCTSGPGRREPATVFIDVLEVQVAELRRKECFISPAAVFGFLERIGFDATLASRKPADKQMVELLTGAVFTLFLDEVNDYYVKLVKDDPPDV